MTILTQRLYFILATQKGAGQNGYARIARIMRICLRDVCYALENECEASEVNRLMDSDLYSIITLLSKIAAIDDLTLRNEVMQTLDEMKNVVSIRRN